MPSKSYRDHLMEDLRDVHEAAAYLTGCLEESEEMFLMGLRDVTEAFGGIGKLSQEAELNRVSLYRMLSEEGNPRLSSLSKVLSVLGLQIQFSPSEGSEAA